MRSPIAEMRLVRVDCTRTLNSLVSAPWGQRARSLCRAPLRRWNPTEVPLLGGNITSDVVRIGNTVRRPRRESSAFTEQLLCHLEAVGFTGAPRWLGVDDQARDILSYLPGRVAAIDQHLSDAQVSATGALLRAFHDATRGSALAGDQETVCHHDCGPHNIVFGRDNLPYALIDFDIAVPGDALGDIGYAAWLCCINSAWLERAPVAEQARQLRLLTDSYGLPRRRRRRLLDALSARQLESIRWAQRCLAEPGASSRVRSHAVRTLVGCKRERAFLDANRAAFERVLR